MNKEKIIAGLTDAVHHAKGHDGGARVSTYMIPNPPAVGDAERFPGNALRFGGDDCFKLTLKGARAVLRGRLYT